MALKGLKLVKQEEKEGIANYSVRQRVKATDMVDRPSEADHMRVFIINLHSTYKQRLQFTSFKNFATLRNAWMLIEEELSKVLLAKPGSKCKNNY